LRVIVVTTGNQTTVARWMQSLNDSGIPTESAWETESFTQLDHTVVTQKLVETALAIPAELPNPRVVLPLNDDAAATPPVEMEINVVK
jgi:hypothetical protein